MIGHVVEFMDIAVSVHIAESCPYRIIDEKDVGEFIPRTIVVSKSRFVLQSIGSNLHQSTIHRTAARSAIQPQHRPLSISYVAILKVPKEEIPIVRRIDFNVTMNVSIQVKNMGRYLPAYPACIFRSGPSGWPGRDLT